MSGESQNASVLLYQADPLERASVELLIDEEGYQVVTVSSLEEGRSWIVSSTYSPAHRS